VTPCRLFVLPARQAPVALMLRRGPSRWCHLILWHTDTDTFEHGAWLQGRIYEERCDLSPDGELFLYFALQGSRWRTSYRGSWTAVSRAPWLHALALWPQGDTWGGGGRFTGRRKVELFTSSLVTHPDHPAVGLEARLASKDTPRFESSTSVTADFPPAGWSGRLYGGDAAFTSKGKLFRRARGREIEIADFNGRTPDPQPAPQWATRALSRDST
jgi:hypothetical protein